MENQVVVLPEEVSKIAERVSAGKRNEVQTVLNQVFTGVAKMREQLDGIVVSDHDDKVNMKLANTIRLGVRQERLTAEKTFDSKREELRIKMLSDKTEDSLWLKAKQTMQILTKEIEENARWKEETKARFEAEQKELKMQQRMISVSKFAPEMMRNEFENMSDETFEIFLSGIEKTFNEKVEAEKKAEAERLAKEKAEQERIEAQRIENERLKKEAEAREKAMEIERKKAAEKLAEQQRLAKIEAEKIEVERKKEAEAREKLEAELKAKKEAELKIESDKKEVELKAKKEAEKNAKAPNKDKLTLWIDSFSFGLVPSLDGEAHALAVEISSKFEGFKKWAKSEIDKL